MNISTSIDNWGIFLSGQTKDRRESRAAGHAVIEGLSSVLLGGMTSDQSIAPAVGDRSQQRGF